MTTPARNIVPVPRCGYPDRCSDSRQVRHATPPGTRRLWGYHDVQCQVPSANPAAYPPCTLIDGHDGPHRYVPRDPASLPWWCELCERTHPVGEHDVLCGVTHEACEFAAGSLWCVRPDCRNPHHRSERPAQGGPVTATRRVAT